MKKNYIYHGLFWASIYLLWVLIFRSYSFTITKTMTVEFCYLIFITADYYAINNFIVPQFLLKRKYVIFVASTLITIALSAWLRALVSLQIFFHVFHLKPPEFNTLYLNSVLNISLWVLLITIGKMLIDKIQTQQQLELLEKGRIKHELDYLKAQINPHALFNSLNTIYGHIDKSNQTARNILLQFSELLRYQLYECSVEKVSLEKEIEYIKNYIAFHRLRKDENLVVDLQVGAINKELQIAPLLLIILIENAFKFVSNFCEQENRIAINIQVKENILYSSFFNTKEINHENFVQISSGIGIMNLKRRLALLYPYKYEISTTNARTYYETHLEIDLNET